MAGKSTQKTTTVGKTASKKTTTKKVGVTVPNDTSQKITPAEGGGVIQELKKRELIDRVVAASGIKKNQAKPAIEAMLAIVGEALAKGEAMNLEPLGKLKVQKEKDVGAADVYSVRIRRKKPAQAGGPSTGPRPPLAKAAE